MRTTRALAALLLLAAGATAGPAAAHAMLEQAEPAVGAAVAAAPGRVVLRFSEAVEPVFCAVSVRAADGTEVDRRDLHGLQGDAKALALSLGALPAGTYRVEWRAVSVDTHRTEGSYTFEVGR